jgi:hypothetical protein
VNALESIGSLAGSCTFALSSAPPDPLAIKVQADGVSVAPSASNGWSYDPAMTSITLTGTTCAGVMNDTIQNVVVLFGCGLPGGP